MAPIPPAPNWQKLIIAGASTIVSKRRYDQDKDEGMTNAEEAHIRP
jgi:hypothetical protein